MAPTRIPRATDDTDDTDGTPMLTTQGWTEDTETSLWECLDAYGSTGIRHVLCTDVARDGAMSGPNFHLYAEILQRRETLSNCHGIRGVLGDLVKIAL